MYATVRQTAGRVAVMLVIAATVIIGLVALAGVAQAAPCGDDCGSDAPYQLGDRSAISQVPGGKIATDVEAQTRTPLQAAADAVQAQLADLFG